MSRYETAVYLLFGIFLFYKFVTAYRFINFFVNNSMAYGTSCLQVDAVIIFEMKSSTNWTTDIEMYMVRLYHRKCGRTSPD
ncbi:hypothetical protein C4D60_Mb09t15950 [Musa balbisiana]|uniref:Uncharacterized protein n=1 Tax=Musa balbisiana TaxID=52838 RepID=A0A4S8IGR0_MUSBA|nr:hypothetical protein C4D60_Mb09t15950 [Musa balbisiana]